MQCVTFCYCKGSGRVACLETALDPLPVGGFSVCGVAVTIIDATTADDVDEALRFASCSWREYRRQADNANAEIVRQRLDAMLDLRLILTAEATCA